MRFRDYKTWQNKKILPQKSDYLNVYSKFRWKLFLCNDICKVHFSNKESFQRRSLDIRSQVINSWEAWYCAWRMRHFKKIYTGCFENLAPRSKAELGIGIHQNHISMTLYQFQINMHIFRASTLFTYFRSHDLVFKVEHIFVTNFCFIFWGCFRKMVIKLSVISVDDYMIPHFKANKFIHVFASRLEYFDNPVWFGSPPNGSKFTNWPTDFLKNRYEDPVTPDIINEDCSQFSNLTHTQTLTLILTSFGKVVMFAKNYILNHFPTLKFLIV